MTTPIAVIQFVGVEFILAPNSVKKQEIGKDTVKSSMVKKTRKREKVQLTH